MTVRLFFRRLFGLACHRCDGTGKMIWYEWNWLGHKVMTCTACHGTGKKQWR